MTPRPQVVVAPNFHLPGALADRLLVADGGGWRSPSEGEQAATLPQNASRDELPGLVLLFGLPGHLRSTFWAMLEREEMKTGFDAFASAAGRFLAFKQLHPPPHATFELVLNGAGGRIAPDGLWAAVNVGDGPVLVGLPGLRLRLGPGEGCRLPEAIPREIIPPANDETPDVLLVIRRPKEQPTRPAP